MGRKHLGGLLGLVCLINGLFSPAVWVMWQTSVLWMPGFLLTVPGAVFFLSPLVLAVLTLLVSGVPAALYERVSRAPGTTSASLWIWLAAAVVLSLPAGWTLAMVA